MIGASEATLQGASHPEKVHWIRLSVCVCVCVRECIEGMGRDHTKTLPGHMTKAGMNVAFWLVREGSCGNRSIVSLFNCEAYMCVCLCVCVCVLEEAGGIVTPGRTSTAFFIHKQKKKKTPPS